MNHTLLVVGQASAQCASQAPSSSPPWLQLIQAIGGIATTVGVLTALYIAVVRDPREAFEAHRQHLEQVAALQRAKAERAAAHARKLLPSCARAPILGDSWWTVRVENSSAAPITILSIEVTAIDTNGIEVADGCRPADNARAAFSESLGLELHEPKAGAFEQAIKTAVTVHFVKVWPRTLPPHRHAVMTYTAVDANYRLRVTVDYEDDEGFQWRRTDADQPHRIDLLTDSTMRSRAWHTL